VTEADLEAISQSYPLLTAAVGDNYVFASSGGGQDAQRGPQHCENPGPANEATPSTSSASSPILSDKSIRTGAGPAYGRFEEC